MIARSHLIVLALINRTIGATLLSRLGSLLVLAGLTLLAYGLGAYLGILPGGYQSVPQPSSFVSGDQRSARLESDPAGPAAEQPPTASGEVAISTGQRPAESVARRTSELAAQNLEPRSESPVETVGTRNPELGAWSSELGTDAYPSAADGADRRQAAVSGRAGLPIRLVLPSIDVDTEVKEGGVVAGKDGELEWETLPFVATTYPVLGLVGSGGNAVISGHVVTLREGNVFRDLYKVTLGESIEVFTADSHFTYVVEEILLVEPTATEVLAPTTDSRLTVITCAGTFDPRTRTFSDRLVVVGKLAASGRL